MKSANPKTGREHLIADGGMLSNFPVWLFEAEEPLWPSFGLQLVAKDPRAPAEGPLPSRKGLTAGSCWWSILKKPGKYHMEAHDRLFIEEADFDRPIAIATLGVRTTEFDLSEARALKLY
ncbi:MAG: hypothetical protein M3259_07730 [Actinomycetota bacterium]|nr:hypothetical protein [Actinomycetota bacterium]